jgi:hypothetical protein
MNKLFAGTLGIVALAGVACLAPAEPVAANDYAFCRQDESGMRSCGFETMEQCVAMISGRGGTCTRDPYVTQSGQAYAYAPKRHGRPHR